MSLPKKILLTWGILTVLAILLLHFLPHRDIDNVTAVMYSLALLLGIVSWCSFIKDPNRKNKPIFLNFSIFFFAIGGLFAVLFVGHAFLRTEPFAAFYTYQYYTAGLYYFLLGFAIVYVVFDTLFNDFKTFHKYLLTFIVVGGYFVYYYQPVIQQPNHLYNTPDIIDFKAVNSAFKTLTASGQKDPSIAEIARAAQLHAWKDGRIVGTLFEQEKVARVAELVPYIHGRNFVTLFYRPLYYNAIYMNILCVVFIFLFFGYQYKNDPPQGAYIEKILFLFLPYCSLEILHNYGYIKAVEYSTLLGLHNIGQYLTLLNLAALLLFFGLRLRFITSVKGEFYERELVSDSEHISRWRDAFDNLIVRHFLNPKTLHGRLFTPRPPRS